ncbi:NUDIX hydrolase [Pelagibius sp.]|uniref:NUDIX hydrolase n=1 Tax=Pelagibius sp. TaxID=1931238 RepID=UPI00262126E8|nr:NUDIX hydrolase [Pelagibius sp.]
MPSDPPEGRTISLETDLPGTGRHSRPTPDGAPLLSVLAVVVHDGAVLLVRRANPPQAGAWGFPGGKVELGETAAAAALRELYEETGLHGGNPRALAAVDLIEPVASADPQGRGTAAHHLMLALRLDWLGGRPAAADDALELCWAAPDRLPQPLCADVARVACAALKG